MSASPMMVSPPPEADKNAGEGSEEVGLIVPAAERCVTPTELLLVDFPSWPRASPKRKQLSPHEESEVAADQENTVKCHRSSTAEQSPSSDCLVRCPIGCLHPPKKPHWKRPSLKDMSQWNPCRKKYRWTPRQCFPVETSRLDPRHEASLWGPR